MNKLKKTLALMAALLPNQQLLPTVIGLPYSWS